MEQPKLVITIYGMLVCTKGPRTSMGFPYSPLTVRPVGSLREHGSQSLYGVAFHGAACFNLLVSLGAFSQQCVKHKRRIRVPTRTGKTGKPGKMGRHFPVREKSGNFEQTGKVREKSGKTTQNTGKLRKFQKKIICYFSTIFK